MAFSLGRFRTASTKDLAGAGSTGDSQQGKKMGRARSSAGGPVVAARRTGTAGGHGRRSVRRRPKDKEAHLTVRLGCVRPLRRPRGSAAGSGSHFDRCSVVEPSVSERRVYHPRTRKTCPRGTSKANVRGFNNNDTRVVWRPSGSERHSPCASFRTDRGLISPRPVWRPGPGPRSPASAAKVGPACPSSR